jgi:hypothetical protein
MSRCRLGSGFSNSLDPEPASATAWIRNRIQQNARIRIQQQPVSGIRIQQNVWIQITIRIQQQPGSGNGFSTMPGSGYGSGFSNSLNQDQYPAKCLDPNKDPDSATAWIRIRIQQNAWIRIQQQFESGSGFSKMSGSRSGSGFCNRLDRYPNSAR